MRPPKPFFPESEISASIVSSIPSHAPGSYRHRLAFFRDIPYGVQNLLRSFVGRMSGLALLWFAFFLSGMAGLSYELTWVRYLTQMFGASTPAVSATVAIFFLGLALGAALGGRWFDRTTKPMLAYAKLEGLIGCMAALVPFLFFAVEYGLARYLHLGNNHPGLLLLVSALVLLVPTTLLGATFPAMAAVVRRISNPTFSTGFFYGFNTLGAVAGCLIVSFWLLPLWGQRITTWAMTSINFAIALLFWLAHKAQWMQDTQESPSGFSRPQETEAAITARRMVSSADTQTVTPENKLENKLEWKSQDHTVVVEAETSGISGRLALVLAAASGFLAIGIEVLWTRSLALSFPASVYVFALVLAAYLMGIGLGSVWVGAWFRHRTPQRQNLWLFYLAIGLGSLLTLWFFARLMPWSLYLLHNQWVTSWNAYLAWIGGSAVVAMLPATLLMGAAFPLLIGLASQRPEATSLQAGRLYAINTIGGVLGSLFVTFWLMPTIGLSESLLLLSLGYVVLALLVVWHNTMRASLRWLTVSAVAVLLLILGVGQYPSANPLKIRPAHKMLFYRDAPSATIAVDQDAQGVRTLRVNNYYGLSNTGVSTIRMQYHLGHIAMLLHPQPKRTLLVGFATGATLAAMAQHPSTKVDCVELHRDILDLAHHFSAVNHGVYRRKQQVHLIADDGRRFLVRSGDSYDVIVGDLYLPRNPGVGMLYSVEHFRAVKRRLSEDGVFVAWLPLFQLGPRNMASIIRSFLQVFPQAEGWVAHWRPSRAILGLVGRRSSQPLQIPKDFEHRLSLWVEASMRTAYAPQHILKPILPKAELTTQISEFPRRLLTASQLTEWANAAPINRVELPVIEFSAPRAMMQARLLNFPLHLQNIRQIAEIRSLQGTPWGTMAPELLKRKKPPYR